MISHLMFLLESIIMYFTRNYLIMYVKYCKSCMFIILIQKSVKLNGLSKKSRIYIILYHKQISTKLVFGMQIMLIFYWNTFVMRKKTTVEYGIEKNYFASKKSEVLRMVNFVLWSKNVFLQNRWTVIIMEWYYLPSYIL